MSFDPRITPVARTCDLFLPVKPGRDIALFNGILHLMIENDWLDNDFINNYTVLHSRSGFEDWPEHERKRLLLRLWLKAEPSRPRHELVRRYTGDDGSFRSVGAGSRRRVLQCRAEGAGNPTVHRRGPRADHARRARTPRPVPAARPAGTHRRPP